jgi:dTDP-4-dehydrorhamnose 3,5-epimerase-like enzyme
MPEVRITLLDDHGDQRGSSYVPPTSWTSFLGVARDMHITTILPGQIRGNHYHAVRKELLVVLFEDRVLLKWDSGPGTPAAERTFHGPGAVLVEADPLASHAVSNTGQKPLWVIGMCDAVYNPQAPDSFPKRLLP